MNTLISENDVTLEILTEKLEDSGWCVRLHTDRLIIRSEDGLKIFIRIDSQRHFLHLGAVLAIDKNYGEALDLVNRMNNDLFLGRCALDTDNDLIIDYQMLYERGLMLAQLTRMLKRFSSLVDYVVVHYDENGEVFPFKRSSEEASIEPPHTLQ